MHRILRMSALIPIALAASVAVAQTSTDPRAVAFEALRTASTVPPSGSTEAGALRLLGFDVAPSGLTPAQQANSFLAAYGAALGLTGPDQGLVVRSARADGSLTLVSFAETYKAVPVFGGEVRVGIEASPFTGMSRVTLAGGSLLPDLGLEGGLDVEPTVSPDACVAAGQTSLGRPGAAPLADPKRMIYDARLLGGPAGPHLVWAFTLGDGDPTQVLCDAHTGVVAFQRPFVAESLDLWEGLQFPNPSHTFLGDENGLNSAGQSNTDAVVEWSHAHSIYNFFTNRFGWRGTQGNDNQLELLVNSNATQFYNDPFGEAVQIQTGWASLDVTAHEFGHGIIHHSSDLVYNGVPGALNEGYADAMGVFIDSGDWLLGEDRTQFVGEFVRNFADPPNPTPGWIRQPDQLSELCTSNMGCPYSADNNGVHTNSGILNKAHYLVASGDAFNGRPGFTGIGRTKMGVLAFHTMRALPSGATFQDARAYSVAMAGILANLNMAGFTPGDACAVKNGFAAVEIGPADINCDGIDDNFQDPDGDFVPSPIDNCPTKWNADQKDWDNDGVGDFCDLDFDNDGVPDAKDNCHNVPNWNQQNTDGDAQGDACDPDDDEDGWLDYNDNCPVNYNPSQYDGNQNGFGDACDPDYDGDGWYSNDNCTFVSNSAQADTDGDGLGDACDGCPTVADWTGAYLVNKWQSSTPVPYQPDSDEDGTPDACDTDAFGSAALDFNGSPYNPGQMLQPGGEPSWGTLSGPPGSHVRIPIPLCDPDGDPDPSQITELSLWDLDATVEATLFDDDGLSLGVLRPGGAGSNARGLRVSPDCSRTYFLEFTFGSGFPGADDFVAQSALVSASSSNPWVTPGQPLEPPPPIPDGDGDGLPDFIDTCPTVADPSGADLDADGVGNACDNCPSLPNASQGDADLDGHGDACDCAPGDPSVFALQPEVTGAAFDPDGATLRWDSQGSPAGGPLVAYDVLRGSAVGVPVGSGAETCLVNGTAATSFADPAPPPSGQRFWYLVRAANVCGPGSYGQSSGGTPRTSASCP
jgi:hypothetical protein